MNLKTLKLWALIRMSWGLLLIMFGLAFYFVYYEFMLQYLVENHLIVLKPGSLYHRIWNRGSILKTKIYIFELTNGLGFLKGQKPAVKEHGPFVFNVIKTRHNITWLEDNRKVSFYEKTVFIFNREESISGLKDNKITVINLPFVAIMNQIVKLVEKSSILNLLSPIANSIMKNIMGQYGENLFERRTPYEIICGRRIEMFQSLEAILKPIATFSNTIAKTLKKMPSKIGYLSERNSTVKGPTVMLTGVRNFSDLLYEFDAYYGNDNLLIRLVYNLFRIERKRVFVSDKTSSNRMVNHLDLGGPLIDRKPVQFYSIQKRKFNSLYTAASCNKIDGSDGSVHDNLLVRSRRNLKIYIDVCRSMNLVYNKQVYFSGFLPIEQYTFDPYSFSMSKENNWCYCRDFKYIEMPFYSDSNGIKSSPFPISSTRATFESSQTIDLVGDDSNESDSSEEQNNNRTRKRIERRKNTGNRKQKKESAISDSELCDKMKTPHLSHSECRRMWIEKNLEENYRSRFEKRARLKRSLPEMSGKLNYESQNIQFSNSTALPKSVIRNPTLRRCDGYHDVEGCFNAPILITYPHFLYSSRFLGMMKSGINPDTEKHKSIFNVEPLTGLSIGGQAKLQINLRMNPSNAILGYDKFRANTLLPFIWFAEGGEAKPKQKLLLTIFLSILYCLKFVCLLFALWGLIIFFKSFKSFLTSLNKKKFQTSKISAKSIPSNLSTTLSKKLKHSKPNKKAVHEGYGIEHLNTIRNIGNNPSKIVHFPPLKEGDEWKFVQISKVKCSKESLDGISNRSSTDSTANLMARIE